MRNDSLVGFMLPKAQVRYRSGSVLEVIVLIACVQRTIQELFEVYSPMDDAGFPVKAEEFVVLSQEPSVSETIAPKIARPFIEVRR